ncbi:MAG: hypothetical protein Q3962_05855 [Corynebacterium sp.]|nr:hypothetical protein [Corynebacterium sp.]
MTPQYSIGKRLTTLSLAGPLVLTGVIAPQFISSPAASAATLNTSPQLTVLTPQPQGGYQAGDVIQFQITNFPSSPEYLLYRFAGDFIPDTAKTDAAIKNMAEGEEKTKARAEFAGIFGPDFEFKSDSNGNYYAYLIDSKLAALKASGKGIVNLTVPPVDDYTQANSREFLPLLAPSVSLRAYGLKFQAKQAEHTSLTAKYSENILVSQIGATPASAALNTDAKGTVTLNLLGLTAGAQLSEISIKNGDTEVASLSKKSISTPRGFSTTIPESGNLSATLTVPLAAISAQTQYTITASVAGQEYTTAYTPSGVVAYTNDDHSEDELLAGSTGTVTLYGLADVATITKVSSGSTDFTIGTATPATNGIATVAGVKIPNDSSVKAKPITVTYQMSGQSYTTTSDILVEGSFAENTANYTIEQKELDSGLYQSAYDAKNDLLYVTRAVGRPPIKQSTLYAIKAGDLTVEKETTPADGGTVDGRAVGLYAVYGVAVDSTRGQVWVSNTRQNTIAVYDAELNLLHQFDSGSIAHSRDLLVDESTGKVYVTGANRAGQSEIAVFSYDKTNGAKEYKEQEVTFGDGTVPMSLVAAKDADGGVEKLYTINMAKPELLILDLGDGTSPIGVKRIALGDDLKQASGVALDTKRNKVYVGGQGSDVIKVIDLATEAVTSIDAGASTLNLVYEPVNDEVWAISREGNRATAIDAETGTVSARIPVGVYANHASVDGKGSVYVVNKAARDGKDVLFKITKNGVSEEQKSSEQKPSEQKLADQNEADKQQEPQKGVFAKVKDFFVKNKLILGIVGLLLALGAGAANALSLSLIALPPM